MANPEPRKHPVPTIRDLYPHLSEEQLKEAEENLERYLELLLRVFERFQADPKAYADFKALTDSTRFAYDGKGKVESF